MAFTILNREQSRSVDEYAINQLGVPGIVLMENAGRGCVETLLDLGAGPTLIVCGSGNNGGDGFVIARHLSILKIPCKVLLFVDPQAVQGDALTNLKIVQNLGIPLDIAPEKFSEDWLATAMADVDGHKVAWIVDALLGTGAKGAVRTPLDQVVVAVNNASARRMAVDIPTGLDCDSGVIENVAIKADVTCTFVAGKPGLTVNSAIGTVGQLKVINIGVPEEQLIQAVID